MIRDRVFHQFGLMVQFQFINGKTATKEVPHQCRDFFVAKSRINGDQSFLSEGHIRVWIRRHFGLYESKRLRRECLKNDFGQVVNIECIDTPVFHDFYFLVVGQFGPRGHCEVAVIVVPGIPFSHLTSLDKTHQNMVEALGRKKRIKPIGFHCAEFGVFYGGICPELTAFGLYILWMIMNTFCEYLMHFYVVILYFDVIVKKQ
jgi:hypothetical protein